MVLGDHTKDFVYARQTIYLLHYTQSPHIEGLEFTPEMSTRSRIRKWTNRPDILIPVFFSTGPTDCVFLLILPK